MRLLFSTSDVHVRDRLDYWREHTAKVAMAHEFDSRVGRAFQGRISVGKLGNLALTLIEADACTVRRTEHYIEQANDDDLFLNLKLAGTTTLHQDGRDAVAGPNEFYLLDTRRPFLLEASPSMRTLLVKIPRGELQSRLGDVRALTARPIGKSPVSALASGFLAMLPERVDALDRAAGAKVAHQLLDLVALAFTQELKETSVSLTSARMTMLLRLKAIIEERLGDPEFRPAHAAAATNISVRYANALLGHEGTSLERFIMLRRLQRCRRDLEDPTQAFRTVSDIAYSHGFSDMSHFTRRFKAQFGASPSACRQQALTALSVPAEDV